MSCATLGKRPVWPSGNEPGAVREAFAPTSNHWIVTTQDKFIWLSESGEEQYFDLVDDPHELVNRIDDPAKRKRIDEMRKLLVKELAGRSEGFTDGTRLIPGRPYGPLTK